MLILSSPHKKNIKKSRQNFNALKIDKAKRIFTRSLIVISKAIKDNPSAILNPKSAKSMVHLIKNVISQDKFYSVNTKKSKQVKIVLGCGPLPIHPMHYKWIDDTWIFTDLLPTDKKIVKMDARKIPYSNKSVDALYASHLLEHISHLETEKTLKEWYRVLKPGGKLTINVPDIEWACEKFLANYQKHQSTGSSAYQNYQELLLVFYGHQYSEGEYHKTGFTQRSLKEYLKKAGFRKINIAKTIDDHDIGVLIAQARK